LIYLEKYFWSRNNGAIEPRVQPNEPIGINIVPGRYLAETSINIMPPLCFHLNRVENNFDDINPEDIVNSSKTSGVLIETPAYSFFYQNI
jgi:hypothetical protein